MELEAAPFRHLGDSADLVKRIDCTKIGRLRQTDRGGLAPVNLPRRNRCKCVGEAVVTDPAVLTAEDPALLPV